MVHSRPLLPPPPLAMGKVRDFVAGLARVGKDCGEIEDTVRKSFGDKAGNRATIYCIIKAVKDGENTDDQRKFNATKTKRTQSLILLSPLPWRKTDGLALKTLLGPMGCHMEPFSTSFMTIWAWLRSLPDGYLSFCPENRCWRGSGSATILWPLFVTIPWRCWT